MQIESDFRQGELLLNPEQVNLTYLKSFLNYPANRELPGYVQSFLQSSVFPCLAMTPIRYQYRLLPINHHSEKNQSIKLSSHFTRSTFQGPVIYQLLKDCSHCLVFLLNLSGTIEEDPVQAFLTYTSFNSILQSALDQFKKELIKTLAINKSVLTKRFAPGYCGWPIEEQSKILNLLKPEAIAVKMTPAYMLDPPHSLTGVYGLRRNVPCTENIPCYTCTSVTCSVHFDFLNLNSVV
jgi:hypothetical protein